MGNLYLRTPLLPTASPQGGSMYLHAFLSIPTQGISSPIPVTQNTSCAAFEFAFGISKFCCLYYLSKYDEVWRKFESTLGKSSDMVPFLSHVHGNAVGVELEFEVDPVAAFHGARGTRQAVAPEPRVGATPTASLHDRGDNFVRTVLKNIKNARKSSAPTLFRLFSQARNLPLHSLQQTLSFWRVV